MDYFLKSAAAQNGVSPITLKRWLITGRIADVARNRNGWRIFSDSDIERIKTFARKRKSPVP